MVWLTKTFEPTASLARSIACDVANAPHGNEQDVIYNHFSRLTYNANAVISVWTEIIEFYD